MTQGYAYNRYLVVLPTGMRSQKRVQGVVVVSQGCPHLPPALGDKCLGKSSAHFPLLAACSCPLKFPCVPFSPSHMPSLWGKKNNKKKRYIRYILDLTLNKIEPGYKSECGLQLVSFRKTSMRFQQGAMRQTFDSQLYPTDHINTWCHQDRDAGRDKSSKAGQPHA